MKKRILSVILSCFIAIVSAIPALAVKISTDRLQPRLVDSEGLLNAEDSKILLDVLDDNSEEFESEIVVVTTESFGEKTAKEFACDFYEENLYGFSSEKDGIILVASKAESDWAVVPYGYMVDIFSRDGYKRMNDEFLPYFEDGDYFNAFANFGMLSSELAFQVITGVDLNSGEASQDADSNESVDSNEDLDSNKNSASNGNANLNEDANLKADSDSDDESTQPASDEGYDPLSGEAPTGIPSERLKQRLVDGYDLLNDAEEAELLEKLNEISERQQLDVVVVTTYSLGGMTSTEFADDFYDYNGYGYGSTRDGILLLVSMEERDWAMSTCGYAITVFTDMGLKFMEDEFVHYLSDGEYFKAFTTYAELCDRFITEARNNKPYDVNNKPSGGFRVDIEAIMISLGVGALAAFIIMLIPMQKMKSVRMQPAANRYVKNESMVITDRNEYYLYSNVTKTAKSSSSSGGRSGGGSRTHSSSSGSRHGGSRGKF